MASNNSTRRALKHPRNYRKLFLYGLAALSLVLCLVAVWASQANATRHPVLVSKLGTAADHADLVESFSTGAKVSLQTIESADWQADLSGLLNLNHTYAKAAGLLDRAVAIKIYAFHLVHPKYGDFLIDTGVARSFAEAPESAGVPSWLVPQLGFDKMELLTTTDKVLQEMHGSLQGVFLSHMHLDHMSGLPAIDTDVPLYIGKGEASTPYFLNAATRGTVDALLAGRPKLLEWAAPIIDIFDDGSAYAIHVPGHTAGSTAFLLNTDSGPVLLTGDASHTVWGWEHRVEPGKFSMDQPRSRDSLNQLLRLVEEHPEIQVRLGHQSLLDKNHTEI